MKIFGHFIIYLGILAMSLQGFSEVKSTQDKILAMMKVSHERLVQVNQKIQREGELLPISELKPIVRELEAYLQSNEVKRLAEQNPSIETLRQMILTKFFHVDLKFEVQVEDYPYEVPFKDPFPVRPTLEVISEAIEFMDIASKLQEQGAPLEERIKNETESNWFDLLNKPEFQKNWVVVQRDAQPDPSGKSPEDLIIENPIESYKQLLHRRQTEGDNASFPEFSPTVEKILKDLNSKETLEAINANSVLKELHQRSLNSILAVSGKINNNSLLFNPYRVTYPYRPTIRAIYDSIRLFDLIERSKYREESNSQVVERSWFEKDSKEKLIEPLYHYDRYLYHWFTLIADPEVIMFPTSAAIGFEDLIRVRPVQIGFVGVETKTLRVDRHHQTPLDFWYHDVNHVRRMMGYLSRLMKKRNAKTPEEKFAVYEEMSNTIDKFVARIQLSPKPTPPTPESSTSAKDKYAKDLSAWEQKMALKKMVRVILFEIIHESALAPDEESIFKDLLRDSKVPQPFEYLSPTAEGVGKDLEKLRTDSGNLYSGSRRMRLSKGDAPTHVIYMHDRALSLLSNVMNKMLHGFYDSTYDPKAYVVPVEFRTPENLARAAEYTFKILGHEPPPHEHLLALVGSRKGSPEKYLKYKGLILPSTTKEIGMEYLDSTTLASLIRHHQNGADDHPDDKKSEMIQKVLNEVENSSHDLHDLVILEPKSAEQIEAEVRKIGKKVYSIFGYSALGYQNEEAVKQKWRDDFSKLDPRTTMINIGVTEEGSGMAYEIAKEMGFETSGFVSTKFLENGGHYSADCDHIFIIKDDYWGGYLPGTQKMTPTTELYVRLSDFMDANGGGEITGITLKEMIKAGKPTRFTSFELNHEKAIQQALRSNRPRPTSFVGPAEKIWNDLLLSKPSLACQQALKQRLK